MSQLPTSAAEFIKTCDASNFRPFAYYDKHLDCIRVQLLDCSIKEIRKNKFITVLSANHTEQSNSVGFNIKGVRHLFVKLNLPQKGVYMLTDIIDRLVRVIPDASFREVQGMFRPILEEQNLSVDFS